VAPASPKDRLTLDRDGILSVPCQGRCATRKEDGRPWQK